MSDAQTPKTRKVLIVGNPRPSLTAALFQPIEEIRQEEEGLSETPDALPCLPCRADVAEVPGGGGRRAVWFHTNPQPTHLLLLGYPLNPGPDGLAVGTYGTFVPAEGYRVIREEDHREMASLLTAYMQSSSANRHTHARIDALLSRLTNTEDQP